MREPFCSKTAIESKKDAVFCFLFESFLLTSNSQPNQRNSVNAPPKPCASARSRIRMRSCRRFLFMSRVWISLVEMAVWRERSRLERQEAG